jgi:FMN phosphatase YigB (HAD superfamily)
VGQKTPDVFNTIFTNHNMDKSQTIVIGDSLRDDIGNANAVGVTSVWVTGRHNAKWSYENTQEVATYKIEQVVDLVNLIDPIDGRFLR